MGREVAIRTVIGFVPWLAAAVVALWAHRSAWTREPRHVGRMLALLTGTLLVWRLVDLALVASRIPATPLLVLAIKAVLGLSAWAAAIGLASFDRRPRDAWFRVPLLALAFLAGATGSAGLAAFITLLAVNAFRWTSAVPIRRVIPLALAGIMLVVIAWTGAQPPVKPGGTWADSLANFQEWAFVVATAYVSESVLALARRLLREPGLGIRRISRRLAISHVLVVGVPLLLTLMLWVATTILGVGRERATVAARTLDTEIEALHASLEAWVSDPAHAPGSLGAWARTVEHRWPRTTVVWVVDTAVVVEPSGSPAASARHELRAWADSLGRFPASTLILLGDSIYAGAAVGVGANPHRVAIALVPATSLLAGVPSTVSGAPLAMWVGKSRAGQADSTATGSRPVRVDVDNHPGGVTIATRNTSFAIGHRSSNAWAEITSGHAILPVLSVGARGSRHEQALLRATIEPRAVLSGLFRIRGDEIGPLPLVLLGTLLVMLTFVAVFAIRMVGRMGRSITSAVGSLRRGAEHLEAGDLAYRIPIAGDDELWDVAEAFNVAAAELERARALEKERTRLESELALAHQIHARLLPASAPDVPGVEIAGLSRSAREVGGDYYDHIALEDERVLLVIADVSGKGVPAALLMSAFRASLMSQDLARLAIAELAERLNTFMVRSVESGRFVTAFVGLLDGRTGRLEYVNAGHNPPLVTRADGRHERLETGGLIFGILASSRYERGEARLDLGDRLVLYTDGVTEGANATGEQWGEQRLLELLVADGSASCHHLIGHIADTVRAFEGDAGPADDVTVLAVRRLG